MIRIGVDIASGETSPKDLFLSVKEYALREKEDFLFVFIHKADVDQFPEIFTELENLKIITTFQTISMEDSPIKAIKKKHASSIVLGLKYLKEKKIDLFFSPGNTGAVIYGASEINGLMKNVSFPAIGVTIPNVYGDVLLLDAGASPMIDEDRGLELAVMGKVYYETVYGRNPEIGILNLGKEWYKGSKWIRKLDKDLSKDKSFNYCGYQEGFDLVTSKCRVFVTGGYTGNILLKGIEGVYYYVKEILKNFDKTGQLAELMKSKIHYSNVGTGLVMGVRGNVFIGHGITSPEALKSAIAFAKNMIQLNLTQKTESEFKRRSFMSRLVHRRRKKS